MEKSVKRVTVIEGDRGNRRATIVYDDQKDVDESATPPSSVRLGTLSMRR